MLFSSMSMVESEAKARKKLISPPTATKKKISTRDKDIEAGYESSLLLRQDCASTMLLLLHINTIIAVLIDFLHSYKHAVPLITDLCCLVSETPKHNLLTLFFMLNRSHVEVCLFTIEEAIFISFRSIPNLYFFGLTQITKKNLRLL